MAGKGIASKYGVKPGDGPALAAAVAAGAARTEAHMAVRDVQRSPTLGANAAAHFAKGAEARAASAAAAELAAKPVQAPAAKGPSTEDLLIRSKHAVSAAKEIHRRADNRASMTERDLKHHEKGLADERAQAAARTAAGTDRPGLGAVRDYHERGLPKAQAEHAAAQAHLTQATADLKAANSAARLAKKNNDAAPKVETPKPAGPPTHTLTEARSNAHFWHREARERIESARWAKDSAQALHKEAESLTGDAKTSKLAEAAKHDAVAKDHIANAIEHAKSAGTFDTMIKSGHVMTADNTTAKAGMVREDFAEHRAARADRLEERSGKAFAESHARYTNVRRIGDNIPLGQPILVGHHSEGRHRRDIARLNDGMRKSMAADKRGKELARAAVSARHNRAISADDPHAITSLKSKVSSLEQHQAHMAATNKAIRSGKTPEAQHAALVAMGHHPSTAEKLLKPDFGGRIGFPAYVLSSNSAEIRRAKGRLDGLVAARARGPAAEKTIHGVRIHEADNRVRLDFGGKPPDHVRAFLKSNGFKWAPSNGSWQRQSSPNAHHYAAQAAGMMAPKD